MLKGNLEKVVQHGKRANSIVKNMLLHSRERVGRASADRNQRDRRGKPQSRLSRRARREAGFNITLQRDLDPDAGLVDVYPQEITRVLLNLISNGFYAATKRKARPATASNRRSARRPEISATRSKSACATTAPASRWR